MIAALPMYDRPEVAGAHDRLWQAIRAALGYGPEALTRDGTIWEIWQSPDLLLAQTCGLPYRARLAPVTTLVGTPDYGLDGCPPGYYCSVIVVRADDPRDDLAGYAAGILAYNEPMSQSGWAAIHAHLGARNLAPGATLATGAHRASAQAVAEGRADFAAIDAVTWAMITRYDGFASRLRVLERTHPTPGLPLITAAGRDPTPLFRAIDQAIGALSAEDRTALMIDGLVEIATETYTALPVPPVP